MFFFFNDTATTEIYTLSLHDALPISASTPVVGSSRNNTDGLWMSAQLNASFCFIPPDSFPARRDRKSTRLNSSHANISYAVFCLKKKKKNNIYVYITTQNLNRTSI